MNQSVVASQWGEGLASCLLTADASCFTNPCSCLLLTTCLEVPGIKPMTKFPERYRQEFYPLHHEIAPIIQT